MEREPTDAFTEASHIRDNHCQTERSDQFATCGCVVLNTDLIDHLHVA